MRSFRHLTPAYIAARLRYNRFQRRHPDAPWLTQEAITILDGWLKPTDRGIEWGSGRSTEWIGRRVAYLHSVEDNPQFYERLRPTLPPSVHYVLRDPGRRTRGWVEDPQGSAQDDATPYVLEGETEPDSSLDFALVDGESRAHCLWLGMRKLKPGGLLVLDNAEWYLPTPDASEEPSAEAWLRNREALASWRHVWTHNGIQATALWVKP